MLARQTDRWKDGRMVTREEKEGVRERLTQQQDKGLSIITTAGGDLTQQWAPGPAPPRCNGNQVKCRHLHQNKLQKLTFIYCTKVGLPFDTKSGFSTENPSLSEQYLRTLYHHNPTLSATEKQPRGRASETSSQPIQFVLVVWARKLVPVKQRAALRTETCLFLNNCARKYIPFLKMSVWLNYSLVSRVTKNKMKSKISC